MGEIEDENAVHAQPGHHPIRVICLRQRAPPDGSEKTSRPGADHGIGPGRGIQFAVDALGMGLERVHRDEKLARDLSGAETCLQVAKHPLLTGAQLAVSGRRADRAMGRHAVRHGDEGIRVVVAGRVP